MTLLSRWLGPTRCKTMIEVSAVRVKTTALTNNSSTNWSRTVCNWKTYFSLFSPFWRHILSNYRSHFEKSSCFNKFLETIGFALMNASFFLLLLHKKWISYGKRDSNNFNQIVVKIKTSLTNRLQWYYAIVKPIIIKVYFKNKY